MIRWTCLAVLLGAATATALAAPTGRVVRIERATGRLAVAPRLCVLHGDAGACVGDEPAAGQIAYVLDGRHAVAEVEIVDASPFAAGCGQLWNIKARTRRGATADGEALAVIDAGLDPSRARVLHGDHLAAGLAVPEGEIWRAIDRDGDDVADILLTRFTCDAAGKPASGVATFCMDVWARVGARMTRTTQLNLARCSV